MRAEFARAHRITASAARLGAIFAALAASALAVAITVEDAEAKARKPGGVALGIWDGAYMSADDAERALALDRTVAAGARQITVVANWRSIARLEPTNAADPADPAYDWARTDQSVRDATSWDLGVLFLITGAPDWAEGPNRHPTAPPGTWRPRPERLARFSQAIATRYSGSFPDPANPGTALPRVSLWEIWGEPNLGTHLTPQAASAGRKLRLVGAGHLRAMVNAASRAIKEVDSSNQVIAGGTAPFGDHPLEPQSFRTPPLTFWRAFFCLKGEALEPTKKCPGGKPRVDAFAHNPLAGLAGNEFLPTLGPHDKAPWPTDILVPDMRKLFEVLRAARRHRHVQPRKGTELWVTELLWETDPPDPVRGVPPETQAQYLSEAVRSLQRQGVSRVTWINIVDERFDPENPSSSLQSGLYFSDGTPKPALDAFRAAALGG